MSGKIEETKQTEDKQNIMKSVEESMGGFDVDEMIHFYLQPKTISVRKAQHY